MIVTPLGVTTTSSGSEPSTLPPFDAARSTITDPGFIEATISAVISRGAGRPGMSAVVMMMSTSLACSAYSLRLADLVVVAHLLGVPGGADLDLGRLDREVLPAHGLHLVGHLGPGIRRPHDRAEGAGRADRGEAGHAGSRDEDLRRRHLARGGDLAGEEAAEHVAASMTAR